MHRNVLYPLPELRRVKTKLLSQCKETISRHSRPLNIAVIGPPGCGKSAFLNTVFASFKDGNGVYWKEIVKMGNYGDKYDLQVTQRLRSYTQRDYLDVNYNIPMPIFLDMTGFEDVDTEFNRELFNIIIDGKLKSGEELHNVKKCYDNNGRNITKLREIYYRRRNYLLVDCLIVVCSLNPDVSLPGNLLNIIREESNKQGRDIWLFGVLTYADKAKPYSRIPYKFKTELGLIGTRFLKMTNYCEDYDPTGSYISRTIPNLDVPVLEFMTQVLQHERHDHEPNEQNYMRTFAFSVSVIVFIPAILMLLYLKIVVYSV